MIVAPRFTLHAPRLRLHCRGGTCQLLSTRIMGRLDLESIAANHGRWEGAESVRPLVPEVSY